MNKYKMLEISFVLNELQVGNCPAGPALALAPLPCAACKAPYAKDRWARPLNSSIQVHDDM